MKLALTLLGAGLLALAGCDPADASSGSGGNASSSSSTTSGDPDADPDADFLTNGEEATAGTDPANPDTDGDGYLDGDEVLEGSDPLDAESRIYEGGWPYQRTKDEIADPGFDGSPAIGAVMPHFVAYDQFGEQVDLYDFALHGRPVVIDLSAIWCDACKDLAQWLGGEPSTFDEQPQYQSIVDRVNAGEIYWLTVIFEDAVGNAAGPEHAAVWAETFPNDVIPVLADNDRQLYDFLFPGGFPSLQILDEDMTLRVYDRFDYTPALDSLL